MTYSIKIKRDTFIDPTPLMAVLWGRWGGALNMALDEYKNALSGYQASLPLTEQGTQRQAQALEAQRTAIKKLAAKGIHPSAIYGQVGEVAFATNAFQQLVADEYRELALVKQLVLSKALLSHRGKILALLDDKKNPVGADPVAIADTRAILESL